METPKLPRYTAAMNPVLLGLRQLGGSGTVEEINAKVAEILSLTDDQTETPHKPDKGGQTEFEYRLGWTRTYLNRAGLIENSSRGVWALTPSGTKVEKVDPGQIERTVREQLRKEKPTKEKAIALDEGPDGNGRVPSWQEDLLETVQSMDPGAFERLVQRFLRESGFVQVEVTGRSGDAGIDGRGIMRLGGLLSFHVIFQCKRWRGTLGADQVRDFRGAMVGRADKGLIVTTGSFSRDAVKEATRDGAPAIDLVDGDQLVEKLKELSLGVRTRIVPVEEVTVDRDWFSGI